MSSTFRFLGTGGSLGVPVVGCGCSVCQSSNPKNRRLRSAALLKMEGKRVLLDCGTDLRQQALINSFDAIDALLITHAHQDHVGGVDDLRAFFFRARGPLPLYCSPATYSELIKRFPYVFEGEDERKLLPKFIPHLLEEDRGEFSILGHKARYFSFSQAGMQVTGFRFGSLAYLSDIKEYSPSLFDELKGVETLVISALRHEPSHLHFTVAEALCFAERVAAKKTFFTHIAHDLDDEETNASLPKNVNLAYDGLEVPFSL